MWKKYRLNILLFILTVLTTTQVGALQWAGWAGVSPEAFYSTPLYILRGIPFSAALLGILLSHEMGHFLTARRYGVDATAPYFIPMPNLFGTLGAVIKMKSSFASKNSIFDIGIAGPLAGFIVAVPVLFVGLLMSRVGSTVGFHGISEGNSILYWFFKYLIFGRLSPTEDVMIHPVAWAGWIGCFVTALNLFPVGQLDGGHIAYAILGPRNHKIMGNIIYVCLFLWGLTLIASGIIEGSTWVVFSVFFRLIVGTKHPTVFGEEYKSLSPSRRLLGFIAFIIFLLTFTPIPIVEV